MATDRQINANRENAKHCTGPKTAEGKERSSRNSLKTGIDAKSEIILLEKREELEALTAEFYARYHPTVPEDRSLDDMLVSNEWFLRRYRSVDAALFDRAFSDIDSQSLGRAYRSIGDLSDRASRRINAAQRNYQRALKQLTEIRAQRANEPDTDRQEWSLKEDEFIMPDQPTATEPAAAATEPLTPESVSFRNPPPPPAANEKTPVNTAENDEKITPEPKPTVKEPSQNEKTEDQPPIAA